MENILTANIDLDQIDLDQIDQIIANVTKENYVELQKLRQKKKESKDNQDQKINIEEEEKSLIVPEIYSIKGVTDN